jgi:hypothetical protein
MITGGHLMPGSSGTITLSGAQPGGLYYGTLFSPAVALPPTTASSTGALQFNGLAIPSGFAVATHHQLDISRDCSLAGSFSFCVTATGGITASSTCAANKAAAGKDAAAGGALPRTGWDHAAELVKLGVVAIAFGVYLRYVQRRRKARLA